MTTIITSIEKEITDLLAQRSSRAVSLIYDNYGAAIYGVILRIVGDEALAKDVMQEAFMKIWKNADSYNKEKGRLFTWLINISRNAAIDKTRSKGYRKSASSNDITEEVFRLSDESSQIKTEHIGLRNLVDRLEPEQKKVIDMVYFGGYTHQETSDELQVPLGTVKSRIKIAIRELKKVFEES